MDQIKIGKFIQTLRKEKGLTQKDLAEIVGVSDKAISKWENGNGIPDVANMFTLCQYFGINVNDFLAGEKVSSEEYSKKAEENIMALLETNKEAEKSKWVYLAVGIPMIVLGLALLLISSFGLSFQRAYMDYVDFSYLTIYGLLWVSCTCILRANKKISFVKALKRFAFPLGGVMTLTQQVVCFNALADPVAVGPGLAVSILPLMYGAVAHIVLLFVDAE